MFNDTDIQAFVQNSKAIDYSAPETIKFPLHVFPQSVNDFIQQLRDKLNYNQDYSSIAAMYCFAAANGNNYKLRVKNSWLAPTIFWFVAVGDSGTMKSHPLYTVTDGLVSIDKNAHDVFKNELDVWESVNSGKKEKDKDPRPYWKQIVVKDYTLEALHLAHSLNPRGLALIRDEIKGFIDDMNKYRKGSDEQFWLESFNNKSYTINRVSRDTVIIDNININIIGTTQPDVLNEVIRNSNGNGLVERFLYTVNERNIYPMSTDDIDSKWLEWWSDSIKLFEKNMQYNGSPDIVEMTKSAFDVFLECDKILVSMQISEDETPAIKNYFSKMKTYLPRFALVIALMDWHFTGKDLVVQKEHMQHAWDCVDYFIKSARFIFQETDRKNEIKEVTMKMTGQTKKEKILNMARKGYKNSEIATQLKTPPSYVSKIVADEKVIHV